MREPPFVTHNILHAKTRESPIVIPTSDEDFDPLTFSSMSTYFTTPVTSIQENASIAATRRKQLCLLTIHEKLGNLSFATLKLMAWCHLIPKDLANVDLPYCPGCAYGKVHHHQWQYKYIRNRKQLRQARVPRVMVSIDQLLSPTPGFVPIHRGSSTVKQYIGATIFVGYLFDFTYCHFMIEMTAASTVEEKKAVERIFATHNVNVSHYHCDNRLLIQNSLNILLVPLTKPYHCAVSTRTIRTVRLSDRLATSPLAQELHFLTPHTASLLLSTPHHGHQP